MDLALRERVDTMKKHILLSFLSTLKTPGGRISVSEYIRRDGTVFHVEQTNETVIRYLEDVVSAHDEHVDCIFYFLTSTVASPVRKAFLDSDGNVFEGTQEDFFLRRMEKQYPELDHKSIPYDDKATTEQSIQQITAVTEQILSYLEAKKWSLDDIEFHVDMTGGMRYVSMMMLAVMQFMKYRHIPVKDVLYSDWQPGQEGKPNTVTVADVTDVYRMFNLVSGTDEFVNFGSVKEIDDYFEGREKSESLRHLLDTMRLFSDAIRICRTQMMNDAVHRLAKALKDFEDSKGKSLQENLFLQILDVFKQEYGNLLTDSVTDFDIIRWCVKKGFLQQAMTLCTEWLPRYIVEGGICYPIQEGIQEFCEKAAPDYSTWEQKFIKNFNRSVQGIPANSVRNCIAKMIGTYETTGSIEKAVAVYPVLQEQFTTLVREYTQQRQRLEKRYITYDDTKDMMERSPMLYRLLHMLWEMRVNKNFLPAGQQSFLSFLGRFNPAFIWKNSFNFSLEQYGTLFDIHVTKADPVEEKETAEEKWERRSAQYESMFANGIIGTKYDKDKTIAVLKGYFYIRSGRNEMNHANNTAVMTTKEVKELIENTLYAIEHIS